MIILTSGNPLSVKNGNYNACKKSNRFDPCKLRIERQKCPDNTQSGRNVHQINKFLIKKRLRLKDETQTYQNIKKPLVKQVRDRWRK